MSPRKKRQTVDEYMSELDHPFREEVQAIREIIRNVNEAINEEVKWNPPSFSDIGEYLATFNLRAQKRVHLVFHHPQIADVKSEMLEGDYADRRMAYFTSMEDVKARHPELERVIEELVRVTESGE